MTRTDICFDDFAADYDASLQLGLRATGEDKTYFARRRIEWLRNQLVKRQLEVQSVLDYGCGCGDTCPEFFNELRVQSYVGVDVSVGSLQLAAARYGNERCRFTEVSQLDPSSEFDLAYCNGVFHHIPPNRRSSAMQQIVASLRPGGVLAFWENNPWNPGTRFIMRRIPFDRDAITLSSPEAQRLLKSAGLRILETRYLFVFPRQLRWLRRLEGLLSYAPLGGQYEVLAMRPLTSQG